MNTLSFYHLQVTVYDWLKNKAGYSKKASRILITCLPGALLGKLCRDKRTTVFICNSVLIDFVRVLYTYVNLMLYEPWLAQSYLFGTIERAMAHIYFLARRSRLKVLK